MVLQLLAMVAVPAGLTLGTIQSPRPFVEVPDDPAANPSPYGYTVSLLLWIVPTVFALNWFLRQKECRIERRAYLICAVVLTGLGCLLDVLFGLTFFTFDNHHAVVGWHFWGWIPGKGFHKTIPIEEIGFYLFGILAILTGYIWCSEHWFSLYQVPDAERAQAPITHWIGTSRGTRSPNQTAATAPPAKNVHADSAGARPLVSFHWGSALWGVVLIAAAFLYKYNGPIPEGFPGYALFLICVGIMPSIMFFDASVHFINWRAFSFTMFVVLFISLFWEGVLAVPYQWWGYQDRQMLGLMLNGLTDLPIEEPLLWTAASWATVIIYEATHQFLHWGPAGIREIFFGKQSS